jgi:hypothetical protein
VSLGGEWNVLPHFSVAAYGRAGGTARMKIGDTLISRADMPGHLGAALQYDGLAGTVIALGWERVNWSSLRGLATNGVNVTDANRVSVGAESRGPSVAKVPVFIRLGLAHRTLPFESLGKTVGETTVSGGLGYALAHGAANLDLGIQRAHRSAGSATENAWLWTFGLIILP